MLTTLNNCTAKIERLSVATGAWATVATGVAGTIEPSSPWNQPSEAPWREVDGYEGKVTDRLFLALSVDVKGSDRITVTPTGGTARMYKARPPQHRPAGRLAHQVVPLADYAPGG